MRIPIILSMFAGIASASFTGGAWPWQFGNNNKADKKHIKKIISYELWKQLSEKLGSTQLFITFIEEALRLGLPNFNDTNASLDTEVDYTFSSTGGKSYIQDKPMVIYSKTKDCYVVLDTLGQYAKQERIEGIVRLSSVSKQADLNNLGERIAIFLIDNIAVDEVRSDTNTSVLNYARLRRIALKILSEIYAQDRSGDRDSNLDTLCRAFQNGFQSLPIAPDITPENVKPSSKL